MVKTKTVNCPKCKKKTKTKIRDDTEGSNLPLYCPKCKKETLINISQMNIEIVHEPAVKAPSREQVITSSQFSALFFSDMKCNKTSKMAVCPTCKMLTKTRIREDTVIKNFPLYCQKCKTEFLVNISQMKMVVVCESTAYALAR